MDTAPAETRPPLPRRPRGPRRRFVAAALALVGAALGVGYALRDGRLEGAARAPAPPTASTQRDSSGPVPAPPEAAIPEATAAPRPAPSPAPAGSPDAGRAAPAPAPPDPIPVHINAVPWARIRIDGRELGTTPLGNVPLAPGAHRLEAHFADGRVLEREVQVSAEQRHLVLEP